MLDLRQLLWAFAGVFGAASVLIALRLLSLARGHGGRRAGGRPSGRDGRVAAAVFALLGVVVIALAGLNLAGLWGARAPDHFPIRIMDLNIPPAAIERAEPQVAPPAPVEPAARPRKPRRDHPMNRPAAGGD